MNFKENISVFFGSLAYSTALIILALFMFEFNFSGLEAVVIAVILAIPLALIVCFIVQFLTNWLQKMANA